MHSCQLANPSRETDLERPSIKLAARCRSLALARADDQSESAFIPGTTTRAARRRITSLGHHRWYAATELGYTELPCVIEELDDTEASLRLLVGNQQTGNDPLDIGLTALATVVKSNGGRGVKSEMSVSAFAERLGKSVPVISNAILAAQVHKKLLIQIKGFETASIDFSTKLEIGRAPE